MSSLKNNQTTPSASAGQIAPVPDETKARQIVEKWLDHFVPGHIGMDFTASECLQSLIAAEITASRTEAARTAMPLTVQEIEREIEVNLEIDHSLIDGEIVRVITGIPEAARAIAARQAEAPLTSGVGAMPLTTEEIARKLVEQREYNQVLIDAYAKIKSALDAGGLHDAARAIEALQAETIAARQGPEHASPAQPGERAGATRWLLEWRETDAPASRYWHPESGWVWAADKALRFARREDAETYRKSTRLQGTVTEHVFGFLFPGAAPPRSPAEGGDRG
jgi:hypothetical protein